MARKRTETFSMSFLDCMSCGFGAILLLFLILSAQIREQTDAQVTDLRAGAAQNEARLGAVERYANALRETLAGLLTLQKEVSAKTRATRALLEVKPKTAPGSTLEEQERRLAEVKEQLRELDQSTLGTRGIRAEGRRQYLTGLRMDGERSLILLDASASMLAEDIVNVLRLRNQSDAQKRSAPKWRRAVASVEWLMAALPAGEKFQVYLFNESARPALAGTAQQWLDVDDAPLLNNAFDAVDEAVPTGGTNLYAALRAVRELRPLPDRVYLLVDGLPTQGRRAHSGVVSGRTRVKLAWEALKSAPSGVAFNIILFPMQGDPAAAHTYWQLALATRGAFISPSPSWP